MARLNEVKYVGHPNIKDDNKEYDLYYISGDKKQLSSYAKIPAFAPEKPLYNKIEFIDLNDQSILVKYYSFRYEYYQKNDYVGQSFVSLQCSNSLSYLDKNINEIFE